MRILLGNCTSSGFLKKVKEEHERLSDQGIAKSDLSLILHFYDVNAWLCSCSGGCPLQSKDSFSNQQEASYASKNFNKVSLMKFFRRLCDALASCISISFVNLKGEELVV